MQETEPLAAFFERDEFLERTWLAAGQVSTSPFSRDAD
jgi:hypothetical protein